MKKIYVLDDEEKVLLHFAKKGIQGSREETIEAQNKTSSFHPCHRHSSEISNIQVRIF
jgi:hypothetical protein